MRAQAQQLDLELERYECAIARLVKSATSVRSDVDKRMIRDLKRENRLLRRKLASCALVLKHAQLALRVARGGAFNPQTRNKINGSYKLVNMELEAA